MFMMCVSASAAYTFRHLSSAEGLPYSWILGIFKDSDGDMWLNSIHGLYCYDGSVFEEYSFLDRSNGAVSQVLSVWQDGNGLFYIGTSAGLFLFDKLSGKVVSCLLEGHTVQGIDGDSLGNIWIAANTGVYVLDSHSGSDLSKMSVSGGGMDFYASSVLVSSDNTVWVGTIDGGLLSYERKTGQFSVIERDIFKGNAVNSLYEDSKHCLWLSTSGQGAFRHDPQNGSFRQYSTGSGELPHNLVRDIAEDSNGRIWIGTEEGIAVIEHGRKTEFIKSMGSRHASLNDNAVYSLYCDSFGNMWVGTFFGGVNISGARKPLFESFLDSPSGYSSESKVVSSIVKYGDNLLVGTENDGLFEISPDGEILDHINSGSRGLSGNNIHTICEDSRGNLWVGTYFSGLFCKPGRSNSFRNYSISSPSPSAITSNNIYKVYEDSRSNLWVGTQYGGLYRYDYARDRLEKMAGGLPAYLFIWDILEGRDGSIWLASYGDGVWKLDAKNGYEAAKIASEANTSICLAELSDGRILVGTEKEGLVVIDPLMETSHSISRHNGDFKDNTVYAIACDYDGDVWLSTNSGLYISDESLESFSQYTMGDGLPENRFNYNAKAVFDGSLYFGTVNGVVVVSPDSMENQNGAGTVRFDALYINNVRQIPGGKLLPKRIQDLDRIVLGPDQTMFAIGFSDYDYSDEIHDFKYRLKGVSVQWNNIGKARRIDFAGLGPGRYTLEVARNVPGMEPKVDASIQIKIRPHWWQSKIALAFILLIVLAVVMYIIWSRSESTRLSHEMEMRNLQREKESEINDLKYGLFVDLPHMLSEEDNQLVKRLSSYIFENISSPGLDVDSLCEYMGMSKSTLYRKLKSSTGLSANEFILRLRVKNAAKLLADTQKPVSEIAYEVGFTDPYYFSRAFKKVMEMSPTQWRSSNQN